MSMKIGDRVTVYRKIRPTTCKYWVNPLMNERVGKSGVITKDDKNSFQVKLDNDSYYYWWFPKSSLKYEVKSDANISSVS